jgi:anhydro-N-acetylmuramic acid kinase
MLSIGLMSGTSMDGIDAALLETDGSANLIKDLGHCSSSYDPQFKILLKSAEYAIVKCLGNINDAKSLYPSFIKEYLHNELNLINNHLNDKLSELMNYFQTINQTDSSISFDEVMRHSTLLHADIIKKLLLQTGYSANQIDVIGYHGQTLFHQPLQKISVILGDGQYLADLVGITVVNDFRSRDIQAGGLGAPLAPLYHHALALRDKKFPVAVVNCGGIANITLINSDNELDLIAFDTGPGNALIDRFVRIKTQGKQNMDCNGQYGKSGKIHENIIKILYEKSLNKNSKNYFDTLPPKALDYGDMNLIAELNSLSLEDACATLEAFTADTIVNSLKLINCNVPDLWILAGGGWNNPVIRFEFQQRLNKQFEKTFTIMTADEADWKSQAMEAQIFAYLAVRSLQNEPLSFPGTTGVAKPLSGGHTYNPNVNVTIT